MVAPLQFRARLSELAGGREAVLAKTRELLGSTHKLTKAGSAAKIPIKKVEKHVVDVVVEAIRQQLHDPLSELIADHLQAVRDEYELMEGEDSGELSDPLWYDGLYVAQFDALRGEVESTVGIGELHKLVQGAELTSLDLTAALLEKINDPKRALKTLGITPEDIDALVLEATGLEPREGQEFGLNDIADMVRARLADGADLFDIDEAVRTMFSTDSMEAFDDAVALLTTNKGVAKQLFDFTEGRPVDSKNDERDSAEVMELATGPVPEAPAEATAAVVMGATAPADNTFKPGPLPNVRSEAAKTLLRVLCSETAITENALSEQLGISRAHMNNYRHGRATFHPTTDQAAALGAVLSHYHNTIADARELFEKTFS